MRTYVAKRLLLLFPVAFVVTAVTFSIMRIVPGDVVESMYSDNDEISIEELEDIKQRLGLDRPIYVQYLDWMFGLITLDLGNSQWTRRPVMDELLLRLPVTLELALLAFFFKVSVGIPLGVLAATKQDKAFDQGSRFAVILMLAAPNFWLATMALSLLATYVGWIPPVGFIVSFWRDPLGNLAQFTLPAVILGLSASASTVRLTRNTFLEVIRQDYIRTAYAKGLANRTVWWRHGVKNAMIPVFTAAGTTLGHMLGGTVLIENIFSLPGLGQLTVDAIRNRDLIMLENTVLFLAVIFVLVNLIVDLSYAWLDPRIRYG